MDRQNFNSLGNKCLPALLHQCRHKAPPFQLSTSENPLFPQLALGKGFHSTFLLRSVTPGKGGGGGQASLNKPTFLEHFGGNTSRHYVVMVTAGEKAKCYKNTSLPKRKLKKQTAVCHCITEQLPVV